MDDKNLKINFPNEQENDPLVMIIECLDIISEYFKRKGIKEGLFKDDEFE